MEFHAFTRFSSFWRMLVKTRGHAFCVEVMWLFDTWCDFREVAWPCSDVTFGGVMWLRAGARSWIPKGPEGKGDGRLKSGYVLRIVCGFFPQLELWQAQKNMQKLEEAQARKSELAQCSVSSLTVRTLWWDMCKKSCGWSFLAHGFVMKPSMPNVWKEFLTFTPSNIYNRLPVAQVI